MRQILKLVFVNFVLCDVLLSFRGGINGKEDKAAALPKFSDMLTLCQSGGAGYTQPLALSHLKFFVITLLPLTHMFEFWCSGPFFLI
jgi:hypothetical protein